MVSRVRQQDAAAAVHLDLYTDHDVFFLRYIHVHRPFFVPHVLSHVSHSFLARYERRGCSQALPMLFQGAESLYQLDTEADAGVLPTLDRWRVLFEECPQWLPLFRERVVQGDEVANRVVVLRYEEAPQHSLCASNELFVLGGGQEQGGSWRVPSGTGQYRIQGTAGRRAGRRVESTRPFRAPTPNRGHLRLRILPTPPDPLQAACILVATLIKDLDGRCERLAPPLCLQCRQSFTLCRNKRQLL